MAGKRVYVVTVGMSCGHELADAHSEMDTFGPYTLAAAEKLARELNVLLADGEVEHLEAQVELLACLPPADVLARYRAGGDDDSGD